MNIRSDEGVYQYERRVFKTAIAAGWNGKEPSVLGTFSSNEAFNEAMAFVVAAEKKALESCHAEQPHS